MLLIISHVFPAHRWCVSASTESHSCHWSSPVCFCLQEVGFCINRVSILLLIICCAFLLIGGVFLHQQSLLLVIDCPLHIPAHRLYVFVSTILIPVTDHIIPCVCLLEGCVFPHQQCLNPVTDHPLCIPAHRWCVSASTESYSCHWSSPVCLCLQEVCFCTNRVSILSLIIPCAFLLIEGVFLHWQSLILVTDFPLHIPAHRWYVSVSTESQPCCWSSPVHSCS